ncbi:cytochrome C oxidase subunit IV family protein [Mycolicibacterium lacusdiani]|uniref:cytochrome C oxidase subunit IV family protein n=1 Tax=Mycolicibacterium lacusdiani TaxID=2895283 RepID=UPI001F2AA20F|nr:cytochrome C oxidase subunit IV family protein [Mycolicibacterium lacusdiani]
MTTLSPVNHGSRVITMVWVVLSVITIASWWLAPGHASGAAAASVPITVTVIVLGVIKSRMILRYFMEIRTAPAWLKLATDAWLAILWLAILVIYLA